MGHLPRFDDRLRSRGDSGDAFRDFAGELLRRSGDYGNPTARDSGGPDGGIDLYCDATGTVVECKFVGADVKDETKRVEQEWKKIRERLEDNLASIDGKANPLRTPYLPWADAARSVRRYVLVTSARLANEQARRDLLGAVQTFLRDTIAIRPGYEHLGKVSVELIDWTNIETLLPSHPALVFRWLQRWPSGFAELDDGHSTGFRAFLESRTLPYLARDEWQAPAGLKQEWTDARLIEQLTDRGSNPVVVLTGPGGVGKTRLGLELSRRLREQGWWTVRCDGYRAQIAGLRELLEESATANQLCIFVDYLETWPGFEAFANEVVDLNQASGHQIRVIATCRASYRDRLPTGIGQISVGSDTKTEVAYAEAVCRHIIERTGQTDISGLAEKCRNNPALAAFLLFLKQQNPGTFPNDVAQLREQKSFEDWLESRLKRAIPEDPGIVGRAAPILAATPLPVDAFDELANAHGADKDKLRTVLVADRWLERQDVGEDVELGPVWITFHDVFADSMLAMALARTPDRNGTVDRLLEKAAVSRVLRQTLAALERLRGSKSLSELDWAARLLELERHIPGTLAQYAPVLLSSALLAPETKLALIESSQTLREAITADPLCDLGVARTALAIMRGQPPSRTVPQTLLPLLDTAAARPHKSNLVARLAFQANPTRYGQIALERIVANPQSFQTHFLLKVWLDAAAEYAKAGDPTVGAGKVEAIRRAALDWIEAFASSIHASFVFSAWLDVAAAIKDDRANQMVAAIEGHVKAWLSHDDHATTIEASFVYRGWLDAATAIKGDRASQMVTAIEGHVKAWLAHDDHATTIEARFVYKAWLDAAAAIKGDRANQMVTAIEGHVKAWLAHDDHAMRIETQFVYNGWLDAAAAIKGDRANQMVAAIEGHVKAWLAHDDHATRIEAQFVYQGWLDAAAAIKGDRANQMVSAIEAHVKGWLAHDDHATRIEAQFVYTGWLEAADEGTRRQLSSRIIAWIEAHQNSDASDFVLESWLDKGLGFEAVRQACFRAVCRLYDRPEGTYILKHVVRQKDLPDGVVFAALFWCAKFSGHEDALNRLVPLVNLDRKEQMSAALLTRVASLVFANQPVEAIARDHYRRLAARATLGKLMEIGTSFPLAEKLARIHFVRWLRDRRIFALAPPRSCNLDAPNFDEQPALVEALFTLMATKEFEPAKVPNDYESLGIFCDWVSKWRNRYFIAPLVRELTVRFGTPELWRRMLA